MQQNKEIINKKLLEKYRTEIMGFAALCIFMFHAVRPSFSLMIKDTDILAFFIRIGFSGVDVFFFLSGMSLVRSMSNNRVGEFYIRRLSRVYFPFFVIGLLQIPIYGISFVDFVKRVTCYSFYREYMYSLLWFVPAILTLYLFFPLYYILFTKARSKVAITAICLAIWFVVSMRFRVSGSFIYGFTNRIPIFLTGCLYSSLEEAQMTVDRFIASVFTFIAGVYCLYLAEIKEVSFILPVSDCCIPTFLVAISLPFVIAGTFDRFEKRRVTGVIRKILCFFGMMSLEFYCVQEVLIYLLRDSESINISIPEELMNLLLFVTCTISGYILYKITALVSEHIRKLC